jgi:hypothetical protein
VHIQTNRPADPPHQRHNSPPTVVVDTDSGRTSGKNDTDRYELERSIQASRRGGRAKIPGLEAHRQKRPTRLRSPMKGPCPGSPDRRPGPGRTLRQAFSCRERQGSRRCAPAALLSSRREQPSPSCCWCNRPLAAARPKVPEWGLCRAPKLLDGAAPERPAAGTSPRIWRIRLCRYRPAAWRLKRNYIDIEHILLGLVREEHEGSPLGYSNRRASPSNGFANQIAWCGDPRRPRPGAGSWRSAAS